MKVECYYGIITETIELPDDMTESQVEEAFNTWLWNHSDIGWHVVEGVVAPERTTNCGADGKTSV